MQDTSKRQIIEIALAITAGCVAVVILIMYMPKQTKMVYDCRLAEISPDFPPEVRNECRKLRAQKI